MIKKTPKTPKKRRVRKKRSIVRPDIYREFIVWMSVADPLREPRTQQEFAQKFGVCIDTLTDWKKRDDFWREIEIEWQKWGKEKTSNVMQKFYQKIIQDGTSAEFKLWFQYFLKWEEKQQMRIESEALKEMADYFKNLATKKYDESSGEI